MPRGPRTIAVAVLGLLGLLAPLTPALIPAPANAVDHHGPRAGSSAEALPPLLVTEVPRVRGDRVDGARLRAYPGRWTPRRTATSYQWLRDGEPVAGATDRVYRLGWADVGHRMSVVVTGGAPGYADTPVASPATRAVGYGVPVRRRVTYRVETRGAIRASVREFAREAQETFDDARGWRAHGIEFRRVPRGGDFTLVLAAAPEVVRFSSGCSTQWSCRVGRFVIINQERWLHASPAWNAAGGSRRDYRHMVVNHETGHWLGRGHRGCSGRGPAPVMMQQSKGLGGCRFNPWPLPWE